MTIYQENHPDEWYQVIEWGSYLDSKTIFGTTEVYAHMRNWTLPILFYWIILGSEWINLNQFMSPYNIARLVTGAFHLLGAFCIIRLYKQDFFKNKRDDLYLLILCLLPACQLLESVRTSMEHFSSLLFLFAVGILASDKPKTFFAGFFATLGSIVRYPSASFGLAFLVAQFFISIKRSRTEGVHLILGSLTALILGGVGDYLFYGRPYESFWMYAQYNLLTDLASKNFGSQSINVYFSYFIDTFLTENFLLGFSGIFGAFYYFSLCLYRGQPLAIGIAAYLIIHAFPSHKEARFMSTLQIFFIYYAYSGWQLILANYKNSSFLKNKYFSGFIKTWQRYFPILLGITIFFNVLKLLDSVMVHVGSHRSLVSHLDTLYDEPICGVILDREYPTFFLPKPWLRDTRFIWGSWGPQGRTIVNHTPDSQCPKGKMLLTLTPRNFLNTGINQHCRPITLNQPPSVFAKLKIIMTPNNVVLPATYLCSSVILDSPHPGAVFLREILPIPELPKWGTTTSELETFITRRREQNLSD